MEVGAALYGTASDRGPGPNGTVFGLDPATAAMSVIQAFGPTGPVNPSAEVVEVGGAWVGTSYAGGAALGAGDQKTRSFAVILVFLIFVVSQ